MQDNRTDVISDREADEIRSGYLASGDRQALRRVVDFINGELPSLTGFVAGYLKTLSEDAAVIAG